MIQLTPSNVLKQPISTQQDQNRQKLEKLIFLVFYYNILKTQALEQQNCILSHIERTYKSHFQSNSTSQKSKKLPLGLKKTLDNFICLTCSNFDLCYSCYQTKHSTHEVMSFNGCSYLSCDEKNYLRPNQENSISSIKGLNGQNLSVSSSLSLKKVEILAFNSYPKSYDKVKHAEDRLKGHVLCLDVPKKYPTLYKLVQPLISLAEKNSDYIMNISTAQNHVEKSNKIIRVLTVKIHNLGIRKNQDIAIGISRTSRVSISHTYYDKKPGQEKNSFGISLKTGTLTICKEAASGSNKLKQVLES